MSTAALKTAANSNPFDKLIEKLKKFINNLFKQNQKVPAKQAPVKATKPTAKSAPKKAAAKNKTTIARKTKPKTKTGE